MFGFSEYLKDYLEFYNISQTEFAIRMGTTQKQMNDSDLHSSLNLLQIQDVFHYVYFLE